MAGANAKLDKSLGQSHCDDCDTVNTPICEELAIASNSMTLLANPMITNYLVTLLKYSYRLSNNWMWVLCKMLLISRNFFSICYPGVTQRDFASRLVQKENPLSH
jgi:hypothetical protein